MMSERTGMPDRIDNGQHRIDRMLAGCDPIHRRVPASPGVEAAFDLMTASIASRPRRRIRRIARTPRSMLAFVAALGLLGAGAAAATNLFIPTRTRGPIMGGGVGALINVDGTDFRQVALQVSSDVPYPQGYGPWRNAVIRWDYQNQQDACMPPTPGCMPKMPVAQLHGDFAASAFSAWVVDWRHDMMTGRAAAAARDARVISGALRWEAIKAEDPHPRLSVPGDMGSTHPSEFGWMIPITQAIATGEVARVNHAIIRDGSYGGQFWVWAAVSMGLRRLPLSGQSLLTNLDRRGQ
jgi:hypothetical protein